MADGVVSFGVQKLWELLVRESELLTGIHEQVTELRNDLRRLKCFLKDADAKKHGSEMVRNCLEEIKEIVYDAEDIIEKFLLKEGRGFEKGVRRCACMAMMNRRKVDSQIKGITLRISKVIGTMQNFGVRDLIDIEYSQDPLTEIRQSFPNVSQSDLVGLEGSIEELTGHLVKKGNLRVVSICGMGGIGKTTLARQVFHHDMVRRHFEEFAWVYVSQQCRRKYIWREILLNLRPKDEEQRIQQMAEGHLQGELFKIVETSKCLIVLDDIWNATAWDLIEPAFPRNTGSKILLTSRNESVASHADPRGVTFKPRCLTHEESWKLLQHISISGRDDIEFMIDEVKEEVGQMIKHCGGLPLAIRTLGGLLATKRTASEWKRVHEDIRSRITGIGPDDNDDPVLQVLSLSYEDLPFRLKHCFLYLAHFPEDHEIQTEALFHYWFAEGIVEISSKEKTIRDISEGYLEELVKRNMAFWDIEDRKLSSA